MLKTINKITGALLLGLLVFMPAAAFAAQGDIFTIISNKMITTIQDVRTIVYVIAGFGLIMFAVLAVFNKISFKHLSYIMIGLSLLAVMMPFINYFSGANLEDSEYVYENFIAGGDASILGSDLNDQAECTEAVCPPPIDTDIELPEDDLTVLEEELDLGDTELSVDSMGWDKNGCRIIGGVQECCEGKINKNGKCKKSFKQTLKDIISVGKDVINAGKNAAAAVEFGMGVVDAAKSGFDDIGDIISGDGNFFDKLGDLSATVGNMSDQISSGSNAALGRLGSTLGDIGSAGDTITGDDRVSEGIDNSGIGDFLDDTGDMIEDAADEIGDYSEMGRDVSGIGKGAEDLGDRMDGWADRYN